MDGPSGNAGNAPIAAVIRQFSPSRIERQLLAQVFELVCDTRGVLEASHSTAASTTQTHGVTGEQMIEATIAGRRAP